MSSKHVLKDLRPYVNATGFRRRRQRGASRALCWAHGDFRWRKLKNLQTEEMKITKSGISEGRIQNPKEGLLLGDFLITDCTRSDGGGVMKSSWQRLPEAERVWNGPCQLSTSHFWLWPRFGFPNICFYHNKIAHVARLCPLLGLASTARTHSTPCEKDQQHGRFVFRSQLNPQMKNYREGMECVSWQSRLIWPSHAAAIFHLWRRMSAAAAGTKRDEQAKEKNK